MVAWRMEGHCQDRGEGMGWVFKGIKPKIILTVSLMGFVSYLVLVLLLDSVFLPYREGTPMAEVENLRIWGYRMLLDKSLSLLAIFIVGLLIARLSPEEDRNCLSGVMGGWLFVGYGAVFYLVRFGMEDYLRYNDPLGTMIWSAFLGGCGFYVYRFKLKREK